MLISSFKLEVYLCSSRYLTVFLLKRASVEISALGIKMILSSGLLQSAHSKAETRTELWFLWKGRNETASNASNKTKHHFKSFCQQVSWIGCILFSKVERWTEMGTKLKQKGNPANLFSRAEFFVNNYLNPTGKPPDAEGYKRTQVEGTWETVQGMHRAQKMKPTATGHHRDDPKPSKKDLNSKKNQTYIQSVCLTLESNIKQCLSCPIDFGKGKTGMLNPLINQDKTWVTKLFSESNLVSKLIFPSTEIATSTIILWLLICFPN